MIKSKKAESLVGIIIAVFILSFTMLGILNIFGFNKGVELTYKDNIYNNLIKGNSENLIKKLNIPEMENNEFFYIKKDKNTKTFSILTGTINEEYQYIDYLGNKVNPINNPGKTYKRVFQFKSDILRHIIYPNEIPNLAFWFDATNTNGTNNSGLNDGDEISLLRDLSGNGNDAYQNEYSKKPKLKKVAIKNKDALMFDGINDRLLINDSPLINTDNDSNYGVNGIIYDQKSFSIVLKTGDDIISEQIIYEEGGELRGYNLIIYNGKLYAGIWNNQEWDEGHKIKSVNIGEIFSNSIYFITIIQNSTYGKYNGDGTTNNNFDDTKNRFKIYINGKLVSQTSHVDPQLEHPGNIGIGALTQGTVFPWPPYNSKSGDDEYHFKGYIGELIKWNYALSDTEIIGLQNYLEQKWYNNINNVKYNIVKININKLISN